MHKLITGTTLSGKSTLARRLAAAYKAAGRRVIVLDELMDPAWVSEAGADFLTDDPEEFLQVFWASRNLAVFIDEAGDSVGRYNKTMTKTATRGRHWGHIVHYITQRPNSLDVTVRAQCTEIFAFALGPKDADALAEAFIQPALEDCGKLEQGEYIHAVRFDPETRKPSYTRARIF